MMNEGQDYVKFDPRFDQWHAHRDKGQRFFITAIDEQQETVEVQHFDGDVEEFSFDEWRNLKIELSEEPENWAGALDIAEKDDQKQIWRSLIKGTVIPVTVYCVLPPVSLSQ
ncbi:MAG: DUF6763 family protein [Gammaproteobacteria bacterium]|nr:DUF6763 family protein [Gammaproteobacteria bacterium]